MKVKSILLATICFCLTLPLVSQEIVTIKDTITVKKPAKKPSFWIGPKFGLDLKPAIFNQIGTQLSSNYQIGIMMQFGRTLYLQPEVYYASYRDNNTSVSYGHTSLYQESKNSVNYIKAPLMVGLKFLDLGLFSLHLKTGPEFSFRLASGDRNATENAFAWQVGGGVDILGFITTDIRYSLQKGVSLGDQINNFSYASMLNLTVGLKLR